MSEYKIKEAEFRIDQSDSSQYEYSFWTFSWYDIFHHQLNSLVNSIYYTK